MLDRFCAMVSTTRWTQGHTFPVSFQSCSAVLARAHFSLCLKALRPSATAAACARRECINNGEAKLHTYKHRRRRR